MAEGDLVVGRGDRLRGGGTGTVERKGGDFLGELVPVLIDADPGADLPPREGPDDAPRRLGSLRFLFSSPGLQ